jgi:hypothetical protein
VVAAEGPLSHRGIEALLVWTAEGGSPESFEVDRVVLAEPGELPAGESRLRLGLRVPGEAPATCLGELVAVRWAVHVVAPGLFEAGAPGILPLAVRAG